MDGIVAAKHCSANSETDSKNIDLTFEKVLTKEKLSSLIYTSLRFRSDWVNSYIHHLLHMKLHDFYFSVLGQTSHIDTEQGWFRGLAA